MSIHGIHGSGNVNAAASVLKSAQLPDDENIEIFNGSRKTESGNDKKSISKHQYKLLLEKEEEKIRKSNEDNSEPIPDKYIKDMAKENLEKQYVVMSKWDAIAWYKSKIVELMEQNPELSVKDIKKAAAAAYEEEFGEVLPKDKPVNSLKNISILGAGVIPLISPMTIVSGIKVAKKIKHQNEVHAAYDKKFAEANKPHGVVEIENLSCDVESTDIKGNKILISMDTATNQPQKVKAFSSDNKLLYETNYNDGEMYIYDENGRISKFIEFKLDENGKIVIIDEVEA